MRNPGIIVELKDGRLGIVYNNEQDREKFRSRMLVKLIDKNYEPIMSERYPDKQMQVFRYPSELKTKGYVD